MDPAWGTPLFDLTGCAARQDVFYGTNYVTGCPFLIKIMQQVITIDKKIVRHTIMWKDIFRVLLKQRILARFLCNRVYF